MTSVLKATTFVCANTSVQVTASINPVLEQVDSINVSSNPVSVALKPDATITVPKGFIITTNSTATTGASTMTVTSSGTYYIFPTANSTSTSNSMTNHCS